MIHVRPYTPEDREFIFSLAPRLTIGMASWRDPQKCLSAVQRWISDSLDQHAEKTMVFVAVDEQGNRLGFASVAPETHFSGERQAYIGELALHESAEDRGAGRALVEMCERWARQEGYRFIALTTGAANHHALGFYRHLGYRDEDIRLTRRLDNPGIE